MKFTLNRNAVIVELAGKAAHDNKKIRITPRSVKIAFGQNEELNRLLMNSIIPSGGVMPNIHSSLLPKQQHKVPSDTKN